ncbi:DUF1624 domain-containing protein [Salinimicrobium tongyeongense]|uniref:DUF1624 domain-containing protein n=1 Tax=Salinimicrobium tongyeongense TaxID=2809707 RepID=A0ABY6NVC2_9FLAO|nr:heparan-alpha-glucosaminide N-acetyltransferase domain-containing protein [Salinimicrobium tongyeongense]UZH56709.1 DUF1624 domain-containing protein [Salinimicrobium tongyeongense]
MIKALNHNSYNNQVNITQVKQRYPALDVLRGMTVALMILVNTPGSWNSIYAPFRHADWHGFTITDLVFPTFLFVVGNAMSFSLKKFQDQGEVVYLKKVFKRTILIFLIGLFLNAFPFFHWSGGEFILNDLSSVRIMGVLQRIAICYFIASLIVKFWSVKGSLVISAMILLGYWGVLWYFGDSANPFGLEGNLVRKIDLFFIPDENLYQSFGLPFDPEGLLSTLPAVVNVLAGYVAGVFIQKSGSSLPTIAKLVLTGIALVLISKAWDFLLPINKSLWTSSYVLLTIGWDLVVIGALIWIIEHMNLRRWAYFFEAFGRNPLFIYALSGMIIAVMNLIHIEGLSLKSLIYKEVYVSWLNDYNASLLFAVTYVFGLWVIGYWMDKKKIYIKV